MALQQMNQKLAGRQLHHFRLSDLPDEPNQGRTTMIRSQKTWTTALLCAALSCAAVALPSCASAQDNSLGVFKRNGEGTNYTNDPVADMIMTREAIPGGIKIHGVGHRSDGTKVDYTVSVIYDGKDYPVSGVGSVYDTLAITQIDANHFRNETKKGKYSMKGTSEVSPDGKRLTIHNAGTDADGNPKDFVVVWVKQ